MKALITFTICSLLGAATAAFADGNSMAVAKANGLKPPRVYTGIHPPGNTKQSAFAPTPGGSKRHTFGAPIQGRIFKMQPQPKKPVVPPVPRTH